MTAFSAKSQGSNVGTIISFAGLAGVVGAAVWAAVAYFAHAEIGILAWGIGALVGFSVLCGTRWEGGKQAAMIAVVVALLSIVAGKYAAVHFTVSAIMSEGGDVSDESFIIAEADTIVGERQEAGTPVKWPDSQMTVDEASSEEDYPADVWAEAKARWEGYDPEQQQTKRDERAEGFKEFEKAFTHELFKESFSGFDLLWLILAGASAYRIALGKGN